MPPVAQWAGSVFPRWESLGFSEGFLGFSWLTDRMRVAFGDCTFDSETREFFREGRPVHLSPKAFRLLELLLEARPRALAKAEIHEKIWPDAFVSEATLASLIAEIREAIGEGAKDARCVRTVHGFGYAFAGAASAVPPQPPAGSESSWKLVWVDHVIQLPEGETILGRDHLAGIRIPSESVSRRHARIVIAQTAATLEDLGSKNGTYLRGERIEGRKSLEDGDSIQIGSATLTVRVLSEGRSTKTEIEPPVREVSPRAPPRRRVKREIP
jgi:DNA-binding winged helix-turn-helix (wHTH) protein